MSYTIKRCSRITLYCVLLLTITACTSPFGPSSTSEPPIIYSGTSEHVTVDITKTIGSLPAGFLGFSYEASTLPETTSFNALQGNLVTLYHLLGQGNIRIGGNSVDRDTFWQPGNLQIPTWASAIITYPDIDRLALFARRTGWHIELAVNLGHLNTSDIRSEASYAEAALGQKLTALECGNEPNDFGNDLRPANYSYALYKIDFLACANAIGDIAPLAGPDTAGASFIPQFAHDESGRVVMLTQHAYTLSQCGKQTASVGELLSPSSDQSELDQVMDTLNATRDAHLPLRIDESNSVNCGGISGISDTYASALWAIDDLLLMAEAGVAGVNFHGGLELCSGHDGLAGSYTPLCASTSANLRKGIFAPQPLYYGMLFSSLLGSGHFYPVNVSTSRNLTAYALHEKDGKNRIMLIEKDSPGATPANVTVQFGQASGQAQVLHLNGSALNSNQDINIQGATVSQNGTFIPGPPDLVQGQHGTYVIHMPAGSAALVTLP